MNQGKVIVREKLVVGYWELIPMESGAELLSPQDTVIVRVVDERWEEKKQRLLLIFFKRLGGSYAEDGWGGFGGNE